MQNILKHKALNGWNLFALISIPLCALMIFNTANADLNSGSAVSELIGFSVRWAVPFVYLVIAVSALKTLMPNTWTFWLQKNRKYLGLCFAVAMAWQALFIFIMSTTYRDYYVSDVYVFRDELEGSVGYVFVVAMVATSFNKIRGIISPVQWQLIHKTGIYFLWAYPFSVYWWNLSYYGETRLLDYLLYVVGFLVVALRIVAWGKIRGKSNDGKLQSIGWLLIALSIAIACSGGLWQGMVTGFLTEPDWSTSMALWLPFWPFEPFISLLVLALGVSILTNDAERVGQSSVEAI